MKNIKQNYAIAGLMAVVFMMLIASVAMPANALVTQTPTIQNGHAYGSEFNVTDNFIDVAYNVNAGAGNNVHSVGIYYGLATATTMTLAKNVTVGYVTAVFSGNYVIPAVADGIYHVKIIDYTNASGSATLIKNTGTNVTVNVKLTVTEMPYFPAGITNKNQFVDYAYFTATVMTFFGILAYIRYKSRRKDKMIEHMVMILFASFVLGIIVWVFIGNPIGYVYQVVYNFFNGIYHYLSGLWAGW
jgi:hypothetical protein